MKSRDLGVFLCVFGLSLVILILVLYPSVTHAGCRMRWKGFKSYLKCDGGAFKNLGREWKKLRTTPGKAIKDLPKNVDRERRRIWSKIGAPGLASAIRLSKAEAIRAGVSPVPPIVARCLAGFFGASVVNRLRYRVGGGGELSVARNSFRFTKHTTTVNTQVGESPDSPNGIFTAGIALKVMQMVSSGTLQFGEVEILIFAEEVPEWPLPRWG